MNPNPPLPVLLAYAVGGLLAAYAAAFGQWMLVVGAVVATATVIIFLTRKTSPEVTGGSRGKAGFTARAYKKQQKVARKLDKKTSKSGKRTTRASSAPAPQFDLDLTPNVVDNQRPSVFGAPSNQNP